MMIERIASGRIWCFIIMGEGIDNSDMRCRCFSDYLYGLAWAIIHASVNNCPIALHNVVVAGIMSYGEIRERSYHAESVEPPQNDWSKPSCPNAWWVE